MALLDIPNSRLFRRLIASHGVIVFARSGTAALAVLTLIDRESSLEALSLVLALGALPALIALFFAGTLLNRFQSHKLIAAGDILLAAFASLVWLAVSIDQLLVPTLALYSMAVSVVSALAYPAFGSLIPEVVDQEELQQANSVRGAMSASLGIGGAAITGLVFPFVPTEVLWAIVALLFIIGAMLVAGVVGSSDWQDSSATVLETARSGWSYFRSQRWLVLMTYFAAIWHVAVWAPLLTLGPWIFSEEHNSVESWAFFEALIGVGSLVAAVLLNRLRVKRLLIVALGGLCLSSLALLGLALPFPRLPLIAMGAVVGAGLAAAEIYWLSAMQTWIPQDRLGQMFSYDDMVSVVLLPIGFAAVPLIASYWSERTVLLAGLAVTALSALAVGLNPHVRDRLLEESDTEPADSEREPSMEEH